MSTATPHAPGDPSVDAGRIGPFKLLGVLGQGSMGVVFDAEDPKGRRVALKTIRPSGLKTRSEQIAARFAREAQILQQLDHPGIVRLIDSGRDGDTLYLAMELVEGVSLLAVRRQGPLGFHPLVQLGVQVAEALSFLHEAGVIHRDIKPANILIGSTGQPVITDFGISGLNEATNITQQGDLLGSPGFMAPEVIQGDPTTPASDLYSLGRLLFELGARGTAHQLMRNRPLLEVLRAAMQVDWQRLPTEEPWPLLRPILARMMAESPRDRFTDARDVVAALRAVQVDDVLEIDTLGGHVQQLDVPQTTKWQAVADDLLDANVAPDLPELDDRTKTDPGYASADAEGQAMIVSPTADTPVPLPSHLLMPMDGADTDDLEAAPAEDAPAREADGGGLRLPGMGERYQPPASGIPLNELVAQRDTRIPPAPTSPASTSPAPHVPSGARSADDSVHELARLTRANRQLREELGRIRRQQSRRIGIAPLAVLSVACLAVGAIVGGLSAGSPRPTAVVMVPSPAALTVTTLDDGEDQALGDQRDAAELLKAAHEHLVRKDIDGALRLLRLCVRIDGLPACHRDLGSLLALIGDPAAEQHFRRYVELAPNAPDVQSIRTALPKR